jgi:hypothetical protein
MNQDALKKAFNDCKRLDTSKCQFRTSYHEISNKKFFVIDENNDEPVRILEHKGNAQLTVLNKGGKEICLVKTDKCLFTDAHKKCDCILFSNDKIYLVEIKSGRKRGAARKTAEVQLADTISILKNKNLLPETHKTTAIICLKGGKTKPTQTASNTKRALFFQEHQIILDESEQIYF